MKIIFFFCFFIFNLTSYSQCSIFPDADFKNKSTSLDNTKNIEDNQVKIPAFTTTILDAKKEGRKVKDGEFQTACTQACSSGALQFGDINDSLAKINELVKDKRKYVLLEDIGTKPNVFYHYKVRNK